ncbi:MAG: hypothetical protein LBQ88_11370 [Treponema sp.]|nr:hypothetical protein [Treponema sp.]
MGHYVPKESVARTVRKKRAEGKHGGRPPVYRSAAFVKALTGIWDFFDYPCGKLLSPLIRGTIGFLEESKEIDFGITPEIRPLLLSVSPAEIDILLKPEWKKQEIRGKSLTKSGPVLKNEIPVRTFFKWDERKPRASAFTLRTMPDTGNPNPGRRASCGVWR